MAQGVSSWKPSEWRSYCTYEYGADNAHEDISKDADPVVFDGHACQIANDRAD